MDSTGAAEINKSIKTLLAELKNEISIGNKSLKKVDVDSIVNKINRLENIYDQLLSKSKSKDTIAELLNIQADLEDNRANLISQIENTKDSINLFLYYCISYPSCFTHSFSRNSTNSCIN